MALGSILNAFSFFSCHCLLLSIICFAFFYHFIWFDMKAKKERKKAKYENRSQKGSFCQEFPFQFNFSADQGSYIKYFLWVFMIVTQFQHHCNQYVSAVFMHSDSERIFNETAILAACSNSSSVFFILFVIIQILPSNDWRETYFKNDGICWWYTLDSIYLNF